MVKKIIILSVIIVLAFKKSGAQNPAKDADSLYKIALASTTDSAYVTTMLMAASYSFEFNKGRFHELIKLAFLKADRSRNPKLICSANLTVAGIYSNWQNFALNIDTALIYANKANEAVKNTGFIESQAWTNISMARLYRLKDQHDKALQYNQNALTLANISKSDSTIVMAHIGLGNTLMDKSQKLDAFRNYMTAYDIADASGKSSLLSVCYRKLADFYGSIEQYEKSKDYLFKQLDILKKDDPKSYQVVNVYGAIASKCIAAKQYDLAEAYIDTAMALCEATAMPMRKLSLLDPMFQLYFSSNSPQKIFTLLEEKKDLIDLIKTIGYASPIDFLVGSAHAELHHFDSALLYFKKAQAFYETKSSPVNRQFYYSSFGTLYKYQNDWPNALVYFNKVFDYAKQTGDLEMQQRAAKDLDTIYQKNGDYKQAYAYASLYNHLTDTLLQLAKDKDLLSIEIDNENKRKEREDMRAEEALNRRHNIQYMGITIVIATVFLLLILMGLFKVSASTIRIIGFLAFIFFFEFIILLADVQIHHWTHGEPWKVMLIKIVLIAMLLPLHHWLEEKVIHYLLTKDLLTRDKFKFFNRKKTAEVPIH